MKLSLEVTEWIDRIERLQREIDEWEYDPEEAEYVDECRELRQLIADEIRGLEYDEEVKIDLKELTWDVEMMMLDGV